MADSKVVKLLKIVQHETGKDILSSLDEKRLSLLEGYYNSLSEDEQDKIDEKIINGEDNDFAEVAEGMAFGMINGEVPFSKSPTAVSDSPPPSSALAVVPKKPEDLVEEEIDSQILSILGLEDVFDLTYEEYASLLKEKAVEGRMTDSQMSTESIELVTNELKRVKGKTGSFKVKPKKVDINKVLDRKTPTPSGAIVKPQKLLPTTLELETQEDTGEEKEDLKEDVTNGIGDILRSLVSIRSLLQDQNEAEEESAKDDRKKTEKEKKKEREKTLEKKKSKKSPILKAITKPVDDFFGAIKKFFTNVILGSVVLGIFKWLKDPKNKKAIDDFTNFLENNAGLILGGLLAIASLPIASTLLGLTTTVIGGVGMLATALGGLTTLLPAFGLFGLLVGGKVLSKNLLKYLGGEDAAAVGSEIDKLKDELILRKAQALLISDPEKKKKEQEQIKKDEERIRRIEEELMPRMGKTQSMKRENEKLQKEIEQQQKRLEDIKKGKVVFPIESQRQQTIDKIQKAIESKKEKISQNEKNIPISQKIQDDLMKDILGPEGAQGDIIDKIDRFIKDSKKIVENLNTSLVQPTTPKVPGAQPSQTGLPALPPTNTLPGKQHYGAQRGGGRKHAGVDFDAGPNDEFYSRIGGEVTNIGDDPGGYYKYVDIYNPELNVTERIAEGDNILVRRGQVISPGTPVAKGTDTTGVFHYEIRKGKSTTFGFAGTVDPISFLGNPTTQTQVAQSPAAQVAPTSPPTPSIPSPTGRGNIVPLPIPTGGGAQQSTSGSGGNQTPVPRFSSEDPNNMGTMVIRSIYNIIG